MIQILTVRKPLNISSPQFIPVEDEHSRRDHFQGLWQAEEGKLACSTLAPPCVCISLLQHHSVLLGMKPVHRMIRAWHLNSQMPLTLGHLASAHFSYPCFLSVLMNLGDA